ncbi:MAG: Hpt domain-containing protein [Gammaproteobacteria bacterium]
MNMKMRNSALEKVAVKKVKHEVDAIIDAARAKLEEYVEDESDASLLNEVLESLVQVERTLQLVQINGAAVLAREMCEVVEGLINGLIQQQDKAQECLSRGILQMSDYLEYVQAGNKDLPVVLLPLLNDLRGVRDEPLLSEHILFFPDLDDIDVPNVAVKMGMSPQEYAKKVRYGFQTGLVGIIQNKELDVAATKMCKVAIRLHQCSSENAARRLWWVTSAIAQAIAIEALATSTGLASLLGQVDRQIKRFIDLDEESFAAEIPASLIKNLLYYVGIATERGRIVTKVKQAYGLNDLIPNEIDINQMREGMSGPNADVLEAVSKALHEDIETVKDSIELYVHSKNRSADSVAEVGKDLQKIADTLSMLGLDEPREDVLREVTELNGLSSEELEHADSNFIAIAETLIKAENIVDNFVNYRVLNKPSVQIVDPINNLSVSGDAGQLRKIQVQTITEALSEIEEAKNTFSQVLSSPEDDDSYVKVQDHFRKVIGALSILNLEDAAKILECIQVFLLDRNATQELSVQPDKLDAFADSITSVECYLEALMVDEGDPKDILEYGIKGASKLVGDEIELSSSPEPLQTVEVEELAVPEDDSLALLSSTDLELKKKLKTPQSFDLSDDRSKESVTRQADLEELNLEELSATSLDLSVDYDLFESNEAEKQVNVSRAVEDEAENPQLPELSDLVKESLELSPELAELDSTSIEEAATELSSISNEEPDELPSIELSDEGEKIGVVEVDLDATNLLDLSGIEEELNSSIQEYDLSEEKDLVISNDLDVDEFEDSDETELLLPDMIDEEYINSDVDNEQYAIAVNIDGVEHSLLSSRGDSDTEVLDIFIEEAEEELEKININREIWRADESNEDALIIIRRAFHTLKGGGRLVGAEIIGEYSWQLENLLNKVIDKTLLPTSDFHDLVESAVAVLNELVFHLKSGREPLADVVRLFHEASNFTSNLQNEKIKDIDIELDDDSAIATNIEVISIDAEALEDLQVEEVPVDDLYEELYELFLDEAKQHISKIENIVESKKEHKILPVDDDLLHALHTLFGCSRTAQVDAVAKLIGPLDKFCQECHQSNHKLKADQFSVFVECIEEVKLGVNENSAELKHSEVNHELLQRVNALSLVDIPVLEDVVGSIQSDNNSVSDEMLSSEDELEQAQKLVSSDSDIAINDLHQHVDVYEGKDEDLVEIFLEEANDILEVCNQCLEKWRANHNDSNAVSEFRRQLHTLKGSARMATYNNIGDFSHVFESFVIDIAESRIEESDKAFNVVQRCLDQINEMVDLAVAKEPVYPATRMQSELEAMQAGEEFSTDIQEIQQISSGVPHKNNFELKKKPDSEPDANQEILEQDEDDNNYKIEKEIVDDSKILKVKKKVKIPVLRNPVDLNSQNTQPLISGQQAVRLQSDMLDNLVNNAGEVNIFQARLEQVTNNYNVNIHELEQVVDRLRDQLRYLEIETETQILSRHAHEVPDHNDFDPLELDRYSNIQQLSRSLSESVNDLLSIKDILSDQVRESELLLSQQRRISGDLQEGLMRTRMVQFNQLVPRLQRIVRQTSRELKKDAELKIIGQNTEVDSSILNRIVAPLEHLVRNAISHGIESSDLRDNANKSSQGEIKINVNREGTEVVIIVSDDGTGLDISKIKSKAFESGLIDSVDISDDAAINLILTPGFSTAGQVSQVSGRGVGMDVVASELKQLGGSLQIESIFGKGTSFIIRIPITLAITQSLLIKCGNGIYAVPLASVEGVVRLSAHELKQKYAENKPSYHYADRNYNLCHLGSLLEVCQPQLSGADKMFPVLLVRSGDLRMAIHVEATLGNREIVVKPLAPQLSRLPAVSGATILGDGNVILILDIQGLVRMDTNTQPMLPNNNESSVDSDSTIMVVDDSITIRKVTTRFLERNNYKVVTAKDGVDAVQKLQDFTPALILLDIEMPRMDGYELATHVRNNARLKNVPIIMITSRTGDKHRQRAIDIGVQEYLGKPYNESELLNHVKGIVK